MVGLRVAFFAYYFPPAGGAGSRRAAAFARHLPPHGFEVEVFTPHEAVFGQDNETGDVRTKGTTVTRTSTLEPAILLRKLGRAYAGAQSGGAFVEEAKVGAAGRLLRCFARRFLYFPDSARGWIPFAVRAARAAHRRRPFDIAISSSGPVSAHVAAHAFSNQANLPQVTDWRDLWTPRLNPETAFQKRALSLESRLIRGSQGITGATSGLTIWLGAHATPGIPTLTIRNGWDPEDRPEVSPSGENCPPELVYTGTLYGKDQDLGPFFLGLARAREELGSATPRLRVFGKVDAKTPSLPAAAGVVDLVSFSGFVPHREAAAARVRAAGLLLLGWNGVQEDAGWILPAKTYEYIAAARPILALGPPGTELHRFLSPLSFVTQRDFGDVDGIRDWLVRLARHRLGPLPDATVAEPHRREHQVERLAELLARIARPRPSTRTSASAPPPSGGLG